MKLLHFNYKRYIIAVNTKTRLFIIFCYLALLLAIAAFPSIVDGVIDRNASVPHARVAMVLLLFIAIAFGFLV